MAHQQKSFVQANYRKSINIKYKQKTTKLKNSYFSLKKKSLIKFNKFFPLNNKRGIK